MPARAASPGWPAPTAVPGARVLVPWRLLAPRYSTIPIVPGGDVSAPVSRFGAVDGDLVRGPAGSAVVTLTAHGRHVSLDPCPDYIIRWRGTETRRGLDCAGVPFRDARGAPYLPAAVPVHFEIALQFDTWELAAPDGVVLSR